MHERPAVAFVYQLIEGGVPVLAGLLHREPFEPDACRHDARIPPEVVQVSVPEYWDGWHPLGGGWFVARIDFEPALVTALLVGSVGKDEVRASVRRAVSALSAEADAVLSEPANGDDRHNPNLDDFMSA